MEQKFLDTLKKMVTQKLFEMEDVFQSHREEYIPVFQENFKKICQNIVDLQNAGEQNEIAYLEYTMLYTNVIQEKYIAEVRVYDDRWYLDGQQRVVGTIDISPYFIQMEELKDMLLKERKRYMGAITRIEMLEELVPYFPSFYKYFKATCRFGILDCLDMKEFQLIKRMDKFEINIGMYMADTEPIYKENKEKDSEDMLIWFKDREKFEYAFEDFAGLDFSKQDLSEIDFRYADLRKTNLKETNLQDALLISTRLCDCNLEGADLRYSSLSEADLTGANLKNANLDYASGDFGTDYSETWDGVGFRGVSFRNANLQNANFQHTSFVGANFSGADLTGSIWDKKHLEYLDFTEEQKKSIIVR